MSSNITDLNAVTDIVSPKVFSNNLYIFKYGLPILAITKDSTGVPMDHLVHLESSE